MPRVTALVSLLTVSLTGCFVEPAEGVDPAEELDGRTFLAVEDVDGEPLDLVAGTTLRLRFDGHQISASAGCNSFSGEFSVEDGVLVVPGGAVTEMGCEPDLHDQDEWFFAFVTSGPALTLAGDDLTLDDGTLAIAFVDEEVATPDLDLVGPTWEVDTLIDGEAASTVPFGAGPATLVFGDDGSLAVDAGCNTGSATWTLDGASLRFADLALTDMACDAEAMALEAAVIAVVGSAGPVAWDIHVDRLSLAAGDAGLGLAGTP